MSSKERRDFVKAHPEYAEVSKRKCGPIHQCHPEKLRIEYDLARGVPTRVVARKYGISQGTASRWFRMLPPQLRVAALTGKIASEAELQQLRTDESSGLLQNLARQRARLLLAQDHCMEVSDFQIMTSVANQIHKNIELTGKYLGEFARHTISTSVNVLIQPQYLELRNNIVKALAPFPEARRAVAEVLHGIESRAAEAASAAPTNPPAMIEAQAQETSDA